MNRRMFLAAVAVFSVIIFIALYVVLPVSAQTNSDPVFDDGASTTRSVDENTPSFDNIGAPVTATDADNDRLVYSLEDARTSPFTIVRATGQLQVGQPLDYEDEATYTVKVIVTDPGSAKDTITVTMTVNNVEEAGSVSMSWTRPQVDAAITATLTDPDEVSGTPTWAWERSSNRSSWTPISGAASATYSPEAGDVNKYLRVTASYTDGESSGTTRTAQAVSATPVRAAQDPNSAPVFNVNTGGGYACDRQGFGETADVCLWIPRNKPAGDDIYYPAHVTDSDHSERRYSLSDTNTDSGHAALFRIDPSRGTLFTTAAHIYDNPSGGKFEITITVIDPSSGTDSIDAVLKPSGGDRNPVVKGPSTIRYSENGTWPLATYSATIKAHIDAGSSYSYIGWIIAVQPGGGDGDFFDIDKDGNLTFTQPSDYENPADDNGDNKYDFSLHVYDSNPLRERSGQTYFNVTVIVEDSTYEALEIDGPSVVDYAENRTDAVANYTLRGTGRSVTWHLSGRDAGEFTLSSSGVLTFNRPPDYENPTDTAEENAYLLTISADTADDSKTEFVRVRVTDVNEPPKFDDDLETTLSVASDTGPDQQIGDPYTATDPDKDAVLTYRLSTDTLPFDIDLYNGQLSTSPTLTQFDRSSYTVTVLVTDGKDDNGGYDEAADDQITVTINVAGGGNNAPEFPATETGARSFPENSTGGQNVGSPVAATDADDDTPTYTLGGTDAASFQIFGNSGQIQTKSGVTYNHETKSSYSVTVTANDDNGGAATQDVAITVTNLEEPGTVTLSTNQPSARAAITAALSDLDGGVTGTTWQWERSSDGSTGWADIGTDSSYTTVDDDVGYSLRATASYTDGHGPKKTAQATTTQAVRAGSNRPPEFGAASATRSFNENTGAGENIGGPVTATDPENHSLTYSLDATGAASFDIDSGTGQIQTKSGQTYDHETKSSYSVTVTADDNNGGTATKDVTITVTNVEEPGTVTLSTNQPSARAAITATLTDPDNGVTGTVWQWERSSDGSTGWADIGTDSSYTTVDDDVGYSLRATASYTDGHGPKKTAQATTTQAVRAGSNRPPEFGAASATRSFNENTGAGENIGGPVTATDPENHSLTYSLEGTDKDSFQIVTNSGQIQTKSGVTYDHETTPTYTVTVKADDGNNGADTINVTITVANVDEPPEFDEEPAATRTVAENTPTDQDIGLPVAATDPEGDDLTYALDDASAVSFNIDISSGQLKTKAALDHEGQASYTVTVTASDGTNTVTLAVTVNVTDVNEAPAFATETATRTFDENTAANTNIGAPVTATDPDADNTLTYSLDVTGPTSFDIDSGTGQIKTKSGVAYDYKTTPSYTVTVTADDGNGGTDTITVTITVANVDEDGTVTLSLVQPQVDTLLTATLDDPDGIVTSVTWVWARSTRPDSDWTKITGAASASYTPVDDDVGKYLRATASYTDPQSPGKSAQAVSENAVRAVPVDNGPPVFPDQDTDTPGDQSTQATREVAENTEAGANIGDPVTATDPNSDTLTYSLRRTDVASFAIAAATGQLQTKAPLNYEAKRTYEVTVTATDPSGLSDEITVTINVTDVDEAPEIGFAASIDYAENRTDRVATYTANDPENRVITWRLSGVDGENFEISGTGELRFKATPDYEAPADDDTDNRYEVTVEAYDGAQTGSLPLTITVTNVDEALKLTGEASIEYAENGTEPVDTYTANDPEKGEITWSLLGDDRGDFSISSGVLTFDTPPDYEAPVDVDTNNVYEVTVKAFDGTHTVTMEVTITVTDANDPPVFPDQDPGTTGDQNTQATREVAENTAAGVDIGAPVAATDADSDTLTYSLGGTDAASFGIDTSTGQLKTKAPLDYETRNSYEVTVTATDPSAVSATATVTINVTDVDEDGTVTLSPLQPQVGAPLTATLTDPDGDVSGETWQWARADSKGGAYTRIDSATSATHTPVAADVNKYLRAAASYTDPQGSGKSAQADSDNAVRAVPVNNGPPVFPDQDPDTTGDQSTQATREVAENTGAGENIGAPVTATDPGNDSLTYSLEGTDKDSFQIVSNSGQIQTKSGVTYDHETNVRATR